MRMLCFCFCRWSAGVDTLLLLAQALKSSYVNRAGGALWCLQLAETVLRASTEAPLAALVSAYCAAENRAVPTKRQTLQF